jgi:hypothetical protein
LQKCNFGNNYVSIFINKCQDNFINNLTLLQKCDTIMKHTALLQKCSKRENEMPGPTIDQQVAEAQFAARDAHVSKVGEFFQCTGGTNANCMCPGCVGTRAGTAKRLELESPTFAALKAATQTTAESNAALVEAVAKRVAELLSKPPAPVEGGKVPGSGAPTA